jgi:hypothetical protein
MPDLPEPSELNCRIIAQAVLVGPQTVSVRVYGRNEGWDRPYISLRLGRLLINVEDAQALSDLTHVVREANLHADRAFGPAQYRPAPRRRG